MLFKQDPEKVHDRLTRLGRFASFTKLSRLVRGMFVYKNEKLENEVLGIKFDNPVGLAAGFDKNAVLTDFMPDIGFGFVEVGSVTAHPCEGNPKPRLHRLVKDKGIIVYYGLCNEGADKINKRLEGKKFRIPVGVSVAKTNDKNIKGDASVEDYFSGFMKMKDIGDYITINISCPNSGDGCSFENDKLLEALLKKIEKVRKKEIIFMKISPDLDKKKLDKIIELAGKYKINGFVISNLSKKRNGLTKDPKLKFPGGVSGKHVAKKANSMIEYVYKKTKGKFVIIGVGGVFNGQDAYDKIKKGASLIQLITGMIYGGPGVIKKINKELVELLEKDGYSNIKEAIGGEYKT